MRLVISVALLLCMAACGGWRATKPTPPLVTPCLAEPTSKVPGQPERPLTLTDAYVVSMHGWANALLGVITADRITWRGERRCVKQLQQAGQVR